MLDFEISYKGSRGIEVFGPENVKVKTVEDLLRYTKLVLIDTAKEFLKENISKGDFPNEYITIVDNRVGSREESVKSLGKIEYVTKIGDVALAIKTIFKLISERTPIRSGYYSSMHILMFNGTVVAKGYANAISWLSAERTYKNTDYFRIINLAPYARKIERLGVRRNSRGKEKGKISRSYRKGQTTKGVSTRLPNGAYWLARGAARRQFPQLKNNIRFSFIPISPSLASSQNNKNFNTDYTFKTGKGRGRPYLYPSITIYINPSSFSSDAGIIGSGEI